MSSGKPVVHALAVHKRLEYFYTFQFIRRHSQHIAVNDNEVGKFPGIQASLAVLPLPILESCWGVHPQNHGLFLAEALPAVRLCAFKIQTVSRLEPVVLDLLNPHFQFSL